MKIETSEVRNGNHNGEIVYICHFNKPDLNKKALRKVPPTKCVVLPNSELSTNKRVYYSESFFSPLNKNGEAIKSKIISPVDNTGYRSYCGNELFVFTTEEECNQEWNKQVGEYISRLKNHMGSIMQVLGAEVIDLEESLIF